MSDTRTTELKAALGRETAEADRILAAALKDETGDGHFVMSTEAKAAYQTHVGNADEIKGLIDAQTRLDGYNREPEFEGKGFESKGMSQDAVDAHRGRGHADIEDRYDVKSLGESFLGSAEFKAFQANPHGQSEAFELEQKDIYTTLAGTVTNLGFGQSQRDPMVLRQHRSSRIRDLFPVQSTTANLVEFYKVTGFTNNADVVPERDGGAFGLKPQSSLTFAPDQAIVRTIAHWEAAHRNVLDDEPQLRGIIDNELLYGLRLQEDFQILQGDGTGENLQGVLTRDDTQTYAWSDGPLSSDSKVDAVRRAITKVLLANYEATGLAMHPLDWEDCELLKDANERYLVTIGVAIGAEQRLWRLPVVDTPAMPEGTFLTGAFGLGVQLYDRAAPSIRMSENVSDQFIRNAITVLAEQRMTVAVKRPEALVVGTFDSAPTGS